MTTALLAHPVQREHAHRRQLVFAWSALVFAALLLPPPSPGSDAQTIAAQYRDHLTGVRCGAVLCIVGVSLLAVWGAVIAARTRRTEGAVPVLTYAQLISTAIATLIAVVIFVVWATAAFRPDQVSPETTRTLNDLGWFLFLFDTPPFMLWLAVIGISILLNRSEHRLFPRWAGYFALWIALLQAPPLGIVFFKTGPFAFNGLFAFWTTLFSFLAFVVVMTVLLINDITDELQEADQAGTGGPKLGTAPIDCPPSTTMSAPWM
jgi:large-conductance mechanosensitive channel